MLSKGYNSHACMGGQTHRPCMQANDYHDAIFFVLFCSVVRSDTCQAKKAGSS